jgi:hypothetical protein
MTTTRTHRTRAIGVLAGGLFLLPVAACTDSPVADEALPSVTASLPSDAPSTEELGDAAESATAAAGSAVQADCSATSCRLTLAAGQEAEVLGTTLSFTGSEDGTATVRAGDRSLTCREGEDVSAGPVTLRCTEISDDSVTLTASLG